MSIRGHMLQLELLTRHRLLPRRVSYRQPLVSSTTHPLRVLQLTLSDAHAMATTTGRRRVVATKAVQKTDVNELSKQLATKLKVTSNTTRTATGMGTRTTRKPARPTSKAKSNASPKSEDDRKSALMKSINSTLQILSAAIQAGWKATGGRKRVTFNNVDMLASAKSARCSLSLLRDLMQGNLDVEKAASSLVGKLLSAELFESAADTLRDVRGSIMNMYEGEVDHDKANSTGLSPLLQLPVPSTSVSLDPSLQSAISSYFSYALSSVLQLSIEQSLVNESFVSALAAPGCFASWIPHLGALPIKTIDSILKRNYMLLTTTLNSSSPVSSTLNLDIRFFALRSMLLSSDVDANAFWEQCVKFAGSYIKASAISEAEGSPDTILKCFGDIVHCAEQRQCESNLMSGPSWVAFCEYWLTIARKSNNIGIVDRIVRYIQRSPTSSRTVIPHSSTTEGSSSNVSLSYDAAKICAGFLQMTAFLENMDEQDVEELERRTATAAELVKEYKILLRQSEISASVDSKLKRSVERLRKNIVKTLEAISIGKEFLRRLLEDLIDCIQSAAVVDADSTVSTLDSLFHLATSGLDLQRAETYDNAYVYLSRAEDVVQTYSRSSVDHNSKKNAANYLRCTAGAYFNVAGNLYKGEKYGLAIRFLKQACPLAKVSLERYEAVTSVSSIEDPNGKKSQVDGDEVKDREVWAIHKAQVYKRWELLGVCYAKLTNRKLAHESFVEAIATFPYNNEFSSKVLNDPSSDVFSTPEYKALGNLIDRVTYIGAAELFLERDTSLLGAVRDLPSVVKTAILERQVISLNESKWKPAVGKVIETLLSDLLQILGDDQPIRRAKLLIAQLEHIYYSGNAIQTFRVEEISDEVRRLLDLTPDTSLVHRRARLHYSALAHLWLALIMHAESSSDTKDAVLSHSNEAHGFLVSLLPGLSAPSNNGARGGDTNLLLKPTGKAPVAGRKRPAPKSTRSGTAKTPQTPGRPEIDENLQKDEAISQEMRDLLSVIRIVIELLGLMGHTYAKMQLLVIARQLAAKVDGAGDADMEASIDFGYELVKLGKINQAIDVYSLALKGFGNGKLPTGHYVLLQLRYAEALAMSGDLVKSIAMYEDASNSCELLGAEDKASSILVRTRERVMAIERSAVASVVFGTIQLAKNSSSTALKSYLQALRLLNRSVDCLSKLTTPKTPTEPSENQDPFSTSDLKNALSDEGTHESSQTAYKRSMLGGHEWRVASALFDVMFTLSTVYFLRGSCREAEYFAKQTEDLARCINSPAVLCRALSRQSELLLYLGRLDEAKTKLAEASELIRPSLTLIDSAETSRLKGDHFQKLSLVSDAGEMYEVAAKTLEDIGETFVAFDYQADKRKSNIAAPKAPQSIKVPVAPSILALILKQHIWLLRNDEESFEALLEQFQALPQSAEVQAHTNSLLGRLALHNIHERLLRDMALNSLAESTVALPMGMLCDGPPMRPSSRDVIEALNGAEEIYSTGLSTFYERGSITHMRDSAVSLALIKAFQAALGVAGKEGPSVAARFLDLASSITLQKELTESIQYKFPELGLDDLQWPSFVPLPPVGRARSKTTIQNIFDESSEDEDESEGVVNMRKYWEGVLDRHNRQVLIKQDGPNAELDKLPHNWAVVSISLTDDKSTLLLSRQRANKEPFVFCIPLRGRRENDEDEHFTFDDAVAELKDIIYCSDEGSRQASQIDKEDKEGKAAWWAERKRLDERMKSLLENIEFCWLGAFKTILAQPMRIPPDVIPTFRTRIEKIFKDMLKPHEKKFKKTKFKFESCLLELFATLPTNCRDEELEDVIYFILDLYHFHGVQISSADIDVDVVGVDLRNAMEEHHRRTRGRIVPEHDAHTFLVLDKNVQGIPWESMPILRGKSVSRIPSVSFLLDRLDLAMVQRGLSTTDPTDEVIDRVVVDPSRAYYVLNPAGDLTGTEGRFKDWIEKMRKVGWEGVVGRPPSEQQLLNAFSRKDLVVYFGHGGAEQYVRSHKIRHLQRCAATMLWGCSSGALRDMGDFERIGTPNNYMLAGCPTLVANLWDVTDRDIDKFALSVFDKLALNPEEVKKWQTGRKCAADCRTSIVSAVAQSRDVCKLKYLTGAAVVVYGIPFYL